ncbi:PREDICTED: dual oxidase 2-like [Branchiostoma belcheri]|uniref:NAD(P)H oxidase (H2O2-forming) n=1 Tax=Branchiostoma belcheri TaxID=7741 RepID=A0A6P4ZXH7_BRABE|nr:PREDICTED: dual oxidase 2-like [Branchiostoma belcheri]
MRGGAGVLQAAILLVAVACVVHATTTPTTTTADVNVTMATTSQSAVRSTAGTPQPPSDTGGTGVKINFETYHEVEYAGYDGWYNNRAHPEWGIADSPLTRRLPSHYQDGTYEPSGWDRPNPRTLSELTMKGLTGMGSFRNRSALLTFFGQQVVEEILDAQRPGCPREYFNIKIPTGDPEYDPDGRGGREIPLLRSRYDMRITGFSPNFPRQQLNEITAFLDGGLMYGVTKAWADALRLLSSDKRGRLASCTDQGIPGCVNDLYPAYNTIGLPMANPPPPRDHYLKSSRRFFKLGNPRGNENAFLLTFGVLWYRWHNYLAEQIADNQPDWSDERVFNEARKWVIATHQKIVLYDWLPDFLGEARRPAEYKGYSSAIHPGVTHVFQSAAMRWGHTIVPPGVYRRSRVKGDGTCDWRKTSMFTSPHTNGYYFHGVRTCNSYWNSVDPHEEGFKAEGVEPFDGVEEFLLGLSSQVTEREDNIITEDLRGRVFGPLEFSRRDLMAINIQRGRDHGLPDYNTARVEYGLPRREDFADVNPWLFNASNVAHGPELLANITTFAAANNWTTDKCDIWVCGLLETTEAGPGELFGAVIKDQFERIRDGDRFWYENDKNGLFTKGEIEQINNITLFDIIKSVTNITDADMQSNPFTQSPCFQPKQLSEFDMEPCTPDYVNKTVDFKRQTFDYFTGSAASYILTFFALGLFVVGCIAVLVYMARDRQKREAIEKNKRRKTTAAKHSRDGATIILATEYVGKKEGERSVQVKLGTGKEIKVLNDRGKLLRTIDLRNHNQLVLYVEADRHRTQMAIHVPKEYDLVLNFEYTEDRDNALMQVEDFLGTVEVGRRRQEMKSKDLMNAIVTKADRQKQLEKFFRIIFAQAFKEEKAREDISSFDSRDAKDVLTCELTRAEFAESLSMKPESLFVEQMFNLVDKDGSGYINFREFLDVIIIFAKGNPDEKAKLMFDMYDVDGDGKLSREEFKTMLKSMMDMVNTEVEQEQMDMLVDSMMEQGGVRDREQMTQQDFINILGEHKQALSNAALNLGANVLSPGDAARHQQTVLKRENAPLRARKTIIRAYQGPEERNGASNRPSKRIGEGLKVDTLKEKKYTSNPVLKKFNAFKRYIQNYRLHIFWLTLYTLVTIGIFAERAYYYSVEREHAGLRRIAGYGVTVTRGAASGMMWAYSIILVTMCRNTITHMRETFLHLYIPFDSAIALHKIIAMTALFFTVMHCIGHAINFYHIATQTADDLTCLFRDYFHYSNELPKFHYWCFATTTGMTGILLVLVIAVMYVFATQYARRYVFKAFWFTHNLYPIMYILTVLHGSGNLVQEPFFYYFFLGPCILFTLDKLVSISRKKVEIPVVKVEHLPSNVTMLKFKRPTNFDYKSGQWVRIASAALGNNEYHPFTLTSAPHEDTLSLHIRSVGPWTNNLRKTYDPTKLQPDFGYPKVFVDGPYGEGHQDWYKYPVAVLIGGGIGVTPFAAILKDIVQKSGQGAKFNCKKVYFLWVTRTQKQFEWLTDIIREVEEKDKNDLVSVHIFITQFYQKFDLRTTMLYICERHFQRISGRSLFTGLNSITHFGRPNFESFFDTLQDEHPEVNTFGVFSCGPPPMTYTADKACSEMNKFDGASFIHHFENF